MARERSNSVSWEVCRGRTLGPAPFFVAGIVNVTPDSFYDGGQCAEVDAAVTRGLALLDQGADILDIGGESTRPGSEYVSADEEASRVAPAIEAIRARWDVAVSVDGTAVQMKVLSAAENNYISAAQLAQIIGAKGAAVAEKEGVLNITTK